MNNVNITYVITYVSKGLEKILKSSCSVCYYISVFIKPY